MFPASHLGPQGPAFSQPMDVSSKRRYYGLVLNILKEKSEWVDFHLQYADRADQSAADFVSKSDSLIDHGHLSEGLVEFIKGCATP